MPEHGPAAATDKLEAVATSSHATTSSNLYPRLISLRLLVALERFQLFYQTYPTVRIIFLAFFAVLTTITGPMCTTPPGTALTVLSWSVLTALTSTRHITTHLVIPFTIITLFSWLFHAYELTRGLTGIPSPSPHPVDSFVASITLVATAATIRVYTRQRGIRIFVAAGVKGLLVTRWRGEYEQRLGSVMEKHELAIRRFCAHMLAWMLVDTPPSTAPKCAACTSTTPSITADLTDADTGTSVWCAETEHTGLCLWTPSQLLLFRAPPQERNAVRETFRDMLVTAQEALEGFRENAGEIVAMESDVMARMQVTACQFGTQRSAGVEEWCRKEWEREFCGGKGKRLLKLTKLLLVLWDGLSRELNEGGDDEGEDGEAYAKVGDSLPHGIAEALRWFLLVQGCKADKSERQKWEVVVDDIEFETPEENEETQTGLAEMYRQRPSVEVEVET
ncbi:hypothetical protein EDC01DRAFT_780753 [Geopyxis carbonaria]|nr:hypothetical protein EDC01DRAFT_780753 [Geopyxis carbonaria]